MTPPPTVRLYWEDPRRKTALATVTGHGSGGFLLDRTLYHAPLGCYRHDQPADRGHVLSEGHKLKLRSVFHDAAGRLVHRTDGPLPAVGAKAQLHLDAPRRERQARAHAAMHLLVQALHDARMPPLAPPRVVGGGEVRLLLPPRPDAASRLADVLARAHALAQGNPPIRTAWASREDAARRVTATPVPLEEVCPGEPVLRLVDTAPGCTLPCDAPLPDRAGVVGRLATTLVQPRKEGLRWGVRIA